MTRELFEKVVRLGGDLSDFRDMRVQQEHYRNVGSGEFNEKLLGIINERIEKLLKTIEEL